MSDDTDFYVDMVYLTTLMDYLESEQGDLEMRALEDDEFGTELDEWPADRAGQMLKDWSR